MLTIVIHIITLLGLKRKIEAAKSKEASLDEPKAKVMSENVFDAGQCEKFCNVRPFLFIS